MNKTIFNTLLGLSFAFLFTSCFPDVDDISRIEEDSEAIENYLNSKGLEYRKTEQGVYIVPYNNAQGAEVGFNAERIIESSTAVRFFDQEFNDGQGEISYLLFRDSSYLHQQGIGAFTFGYLDGIVNMKRDELAQLYIPSDLAYGGTSFQNLPAHSIIVADSVSVLDVRTLDDQKFEEEDLIRDYLADNHGVTDFSVNNPNMERGENGVLVYTEVLAADTARMIEENDLLSVSYVGKHLDGTVFDESDNFQFRVLVDPDPSIPNQVIPGWYEAVLMMQEGDSSVVGIPSHMAYGAAGSPPAIDAFETLIFEIKVKSIDN